MLDTGFCALTPYLTSSCSCQHTVTILCFTYPVSYIFKRIMYTVRGMCRSINAMICIYIYTLHILYNILNMITYFHRTKKTKKGCNFQVKVKDTLENMSSDLVVFLFLKTRPWQTNIKYFVMIFRLLVSKQNKQILYF